MNKLHIIASCLLFIIGTALYLAIYGQDESKETT